MSKRNIQDLARFLAGKYEEANVVLEEAGQALADTMLSPEEQKVFAEKKALVDGLLSTLSVGLSAAAQGKIEELIKQVTTEYTAFAEPLRNLVDNLADPAISEEQKITSEQLIKMYNDKIRAIDTTLEQLKIIKFYANLASSRKKQRKYFREVFFSACEDVYHSLGEQKQAAYTRYSPFKQVDEALLALKDYISQFNTATAETPVDDLSE